VPRPLRLQAAGARYHITTHSNFGRVAFRHDFERAQFLALLDATVQRCGWSCHSYCLLSTHYHLVVVTPEPNIAIGMQYLNGRYAQWANWARNERGHIFEGRYYSVHVETDAHAAEVHRYIAMNPVRAGLVRDPEDWPWSSLPATLGRKRRPAFLDVDAVLGEFGSTPSSARRRLRMFVRAGLAADRA
jgi:REP element-mobilizing transposase RayT